MSEKIQKVLANVGLGSRRQIEGWITEGRISVNGQMAKLGDRITLDDKVRVDGREVKFNKTAGKKVRVLIYHKPEGEICSRSDPEGRATIFDRLPLLRNGRWITIGRLDYNTSGLLLLTNDGELANQLMHPSAEIEREYAVRVQGQVTSSMLTQLRKGVQLEDGLAHFDQITDAGGEGSNHWYHVIVKEGRNRLVRRLWEAMGVNVSRLTRVRFGNMTLPRMLRRGRWEDLTLDEMTALQNSLIKHEDVEVEEVIKSPAKPQKSHREKFIRKPIRR
jgi:23S rRNA pseudouridine2605 synthase